MSTKKILNSIVLVLLIGLSSVVLSAKDESIGEIQQQNKTATTGAETLSFSSSHIDLNISEEENLLHKLNFNGSSEKLQWESMYPEVASVSDNGVVKAISDGHSIIRVSLKENHDIYADCSIGVNLSEVYLVGSLNNWDISDKTFVLKRVEDSNRFEGIYYVPATKNFNYGNEFTIVTNSGSWNIAYGNPYINQSLFQHLTDNAFNIESWPVLPNVDHFTLDNKWEGGYIKFMFFIDSSRLGVEVNKYIDSSTVENEGIEDIAIESINRKWGTSKEDVITDQGGFSLYSNDDKSLIFKKVINQDYDIFLSYKFDDNNQLIAAALSLPENEDTKRLIDDWFAEYDSDITVKNSMEVKYDEDQIIIVDTSSSFENHNVISIGFSYYEPIEERDDCVDLGLSVRWATMNMGASSPDGVGSFYAFSETNTKSEYWRENYTFCNNSSNQYIFKYSNPLTDICGTKYDAATEKLGDGWRLPSLAEANELISKCEWNVEKLNGKSVYRVVGPNGNSIIIPIVGFKKQNKSYADYMLHLAIGECSSKSGEYCYLLSTDYANGKYVGSITSEWKAWGYNIRPVYTK